MVLICGGPKGAGMQEIYQVTSALKQLPHCKHVAVLTDARFSGVSTGACIGHVSPEALAGGPVGQSARRRPDRDRHRPQRADRHGRSGRRRRMRLFGAEEGPQTPRSATPRPDLAPHPALPDDTRLWAALVQASGGVWGGCVYDTDRIVAQLERGREV